MKKELMTVMIAGAVAMGAGVVYATPELTKEAEGFKDREAAIASKDFFDSNYLWNESEKEKMVINPASKKKTADAWKPSRELTEEECIKMMQILSDLFGLPGKFRRGYASFVYVWRFEGDEWLSIGVTTRANLGGDPIAIEHWVWRKPKMSIDTEDEMKERVYPIVKIEDEGLPPAAFFELFYPYSGMNGEPDCNTVTEFNVAKYSGSRCIAEWVADDCCYYIWTKRPDESRGERAIKAEDGKCHVGSVQFYKLAQNLFMCNSSLHVDGSIGAESANYLFEVCEREIVDYDKTIKTKVVRYLGRFSIDRVSAFKDEWIKKRLLEKK